MSRIDNMLQRLCPGGVPVRALGDVGTFIRGGGMQKADLVEEGYPAIHYGQIHTLYGTSTTKTRSFVAPEFAEKLRKAEPGDIVIATTSEDDDAVAKAVAWLGDKPAAISGDAYIYRHTLVPKYVAYFFQSDQFNDQKKRSITGTKVKRISGESLAKIMLPVPPVEVQEEVVRTLDNLQSLDAELNAELGVELEARLAQHAYYRDALLAPEGAEVPRIPLGELADFKYGFTASAAASGEYRFLRITDITPAGKLSPSGAKYVASSAAAQEYLVQPGDLLMARTGATYGKTMLVMPDEPAIYASFLIRIRFKQPNVLPAYYWHFAQSELYWSQANAMVSRGGQPQFNANVLKLVEVPVPPVEEQERIVSLLDRLDSLVSELAIRLPAEQTARRAQYTYYRDRLLAFKGAAA